MSCATNIWPLRGHETWRYYRSTNVRPLRDRVCGVDFVCYKCLTSPGSWNIAILSSYKCSTSGSRGWCRVLQMFDLSEVVKHGGFIVLQCATSPRSSLAWPRRGHIFVAQTRSQFFTTSERSNICKTSNHCARVVQVICCSCGWVLVSGVRGALTGVLLF